MFSKFFAYLFALEQEVVHDVEAIIADFTNTVTRLEAAAEAKALEAAKFTQQSIDAEALADVAYSAAEKAKAVAVKIKDLVS